MSFSAKIDLKTFSRVATCVSVDSTRYYLSGVQVEPSPNGGAIMIATDGNIMICVHDSQGYVAPGTSGIVILPPELLKAKSIKPLERHEVEINGDQATFEGVSAFGVLIDGQYPDWRRVIPSDYAQTAGEGVAFNAVQYARLAKALCGKSKDHTVAVYGASKSDPHYMIGNLSLGSAFGIIMPVRDGPVPIKAKPFFI